MKQDASEVTVRVKTTLRKFNADEAFVPGATPIETIVREEDVPLSSLPPEMQQQLKGTAHGTD